MLTAPPSPQPKKKKLHFIVAGSYYDVGKAARKLIKSIVSD
jgi:hypothetical protein